jgi:hypothetical protein
MNHNVPQRERDFFDRRWQATRAVPVQEPLAIPGVELAGKRVLICSCGSGVEPVQAAIAGAHV